MTLKERLDKEVYARNSLCELSYEKPDPLFVAQKQNDEYAILLCALFGYGNAKLIVKFLESLDFELLNCNETIIEKELEGFYYRFQNQGDIQAIFKALHRLKQTQSLEELFLKGYLKEECVLEGIESVIQAIQNVFAYESQGYRFLIGSLFKRDKNAQIKAIGNAPYKRWNMFLRWMVRNDALDLGLWKKAHTKDLILPLDTHTFKVSQQLGLLQRKTYDLQSALLITEHLKCFDVNDPIKYDFALYRIGQEKMI